MTPVCNIDQPLRILDHDLADAMELNNNLFWNDGDEISIRWEPDLTVRTGSQFNELPGHNIQGNLVANPILEDGPGINFNLDSQSHAIDKANDDLIQLDIDYRNRFGHGRSTLRDFNGLDRTNCRIDIGAYEYSCESNENMNPRRWIDPARQQWTRC